MTQFIQKIFNKRTLPAILSGIAVVGVGATGYLSAKCTKKAETKTTTKDKVIAYAPAIASGVGTAACIIGSHYISAKEIATLSAAATYAITNRDKLKKAIEQRYGKDELKDICESNCEIPSKQNIEWTGHGTLKCLEGYSGRMFYSSLEAVKEAEEKLSKMFSDGVYLSLNDFYEFLGIQKTHFGNQFGWVPHTDYYEYDGEHPIEFKNSIMKDKDGNPVLVIDVYTYPMEGWLEL